MIGTSNQIEMAEQIRPLVDAEFERVARAFREVAERQAGARQDDTRAVLKILEEKRIEVLATPEAGYFIREWRELNGQVRGIIALDPRYQAIQAGRRGRV